MINERQGIKNTQLVFDKIYIDGYGVISLEELIAAYQKTNVNISSEHTQHLFEEAGIDDNRTLSSDKFLKVA